MSGPILTSPILEVPPAAPGQTLELDLEVVTDQETLLASLLLNLSPLSTDSFPSCPAGLFCCDSDQEGVQEAAYALVTPCGQPFGDLLQLRAGAKPSLPSCVVLKVPGLQY